jgi:hypothetical protein
MPDVRAKGRQKKADACKYSTTKCCRLAFPSKSFAKQSEEERHREVYDPIEGCADDTSEITISFQCPVTGKIFLEDTVTHGEACYVSSDIIESTD